MISDFLPTARQLAQRAGQAILAIRQHSFSSHRKEDKSLVTEADLRSDELIRDGLMKAFPEHAILTEENGLSGNPKSDRIWVVDPLDGTKAFAKLIPGFSVMIGLLEKGKPVLGVVVDPLEDRTYEAVRGEGAFQWIKGRRELLEVSTRARFEEMPLVTSTGFPEAQLKELSPTLSGPKIHPINSVGIKVGLLVRKIGDIYINHHSVHYWDTAAPQVILEEAGGVFTQLDGATLHYDLTRSGFSHEIRTLATNGERHAEIAALCQKVFG